VAATDRADVAATVPTSSLRLRQVTGMDPGLGLIEVTGEGIRTTADIAPADWSSALALGRLALAHELVGASRTMLELARRHALDRIQFGRPIASFQAVRHRLAETLVGIEMAGAALDAAWLDRSADAAAMAKAVAGRQGRTTARHCQQVLAGIGFTAEHPLHRYVRRTLVLDGLLGSAASITRALGAAMMASRQLPPLLPL
jgi:alkylation response protein AidB-like acyl-CoA dehydrogenase